MNRSAWCGVVLGTVGSVAQAQTIDFQSASTLDRWMYPFNGTPGSRFNASTFGIPRLDGFDDHESQFIVGFRTDSAIPTGLAPDQYRVISARVTATVSNDQQFEYDPTSDDRHTVDSQEGGYPDLIPDSDPGRPVELFALGYRDGYTPQTWTETTTFGLHPTVPPAQEARTAFMAVLDSAGNATDGSNNLRQEFDLSPLAVGQTDAVAPGDLVPADTTFTFDINLCDPGTRAYLAQGLAAGEVRFSIASLHYAEGGPAGGSGPALYPEWYTRENPVAQILGYAPTVELTVRVGPIGDYTGDGVRNFFDIQAFVNDYNAHVPLADLTGDCQFNFFDIQAFVNAYNTP